MMFYSRMSAEMSFTTNVITHFRGVQRVKVFFFLICYTNLVIINTW